MSTRRYSYKTLCDKCSNVVTVIKNSYNGIDYYFDELDAVVYTKAGTVNNQPLVAHQCKVAVPNSTEARSAMVDKANELAGVLAGMTIGNDNRERVEELRKLADKAKDTGTNLKSLSNKILNTYALGRPCPSCTAKIGERCLDKSANQRKYNNYPHQERLPDADSKARLVSKQVKTLDESANAFIEGTDNEVIGTVYEEVADEFIDLYKHNLENAVKFFTRQDIVHSNNIIL